MDLSKSINLISIDKTESIESMHVVILGERLLEGDTYKREFPKTINEKKLN